MKTCIKMEEKIIKFGDIELKKQKFHQHKSHISIRNMDFDYILVLKRFLLVKKGFKYFIGYKNAEKVDLYVYISKKWVHMKETLMKQNTCVFW